MSNGKSILITGASRGIGAALAKAFAREGYAFIGINYHSDGDGARSVAEAVRGIGARAELYQADVSENADCERMLAAFLADAGKIDVLINNAGGAQSIPAGGFAEMPVEYWERQIRMNLSCAAYCSRIAVGDMIQKGIKGRIINISSIHSQITWVKRKALPYCAGKAGMNMLTKTLGVEVAKYGINVNCIAPGFIQTKLTTRYTEEQIAAFERKIPAGVLGRPDDIVPMALLLADEEKSRFIVGQTFVIDGGQSIDGAIDSMMYDF
ncbi:MAG: SDR family NAD(P)-dependent oxidoreductase [Candidatus Merdivicinus sp.]|jgi:NAD(P)-dependent dehydrogenase (short-subunit alcohol dehydrogenase family)